MKLFLNLFTDQIDDSFVEFLIDAIENAADDEEGEQLVDTFVPLILAFNQHFVGMNNMKFIIILTMLHVVIKWNNA